MARSSTVAPLSLTICTQDVDEEDFEEEQNLVARLVHHLACPNSEGQYRVLLAARRHFGQGGPKRLRHTLPPLIFSGLQLVRQLHAQPAETEGTRVSRRTCCLALADLPRLGDVQASASRSRNCFSSCTRPRRRSPRSRAQRLRCDCTCSVRKLQATATSSQSPMSSWSARTKSSRRAFQVSNEALGNTQQNALTFLVCVTDSKAQVTALQLIIGSLQRCTVFGSENRASLVHKATGYSAKLLKKPDQCRAVYTCAHLFWHDTDETLCDAESVLACLKRALKIANASQVTSWLAPLCTHLLNGASACRLCQPRAEASPPAWRCSLRSSTSASPSQHVLGWFLLTPVLAPGTFTSSTRAARRSRRRC